MSPDDMNPIAEHSTDLPPQPDTESRQDLRKRAEARAGEMPEELEDLSSEATRSMLHELRVHQIELEIQNEELLRTQEELEASRERYFDLYDLAPVGYFTITEKGLIREANLTAAKLLGMPRGALLKQPFTRFVFREDQDIYYMNRKALFAGTLQSWELRMLKNDATPFWVQVAATGALEVDGTALCRVVVSDITKRKTAEEEKAKLAAQNRQLQKAEGLGRMAGAIAHYFNNHLTAVIGNLELSIGDLPRGTGSAERLTQALDAALEAAKVSELMLTYVGKAQARHDRLDLAVVCRQSLPLLQAAMPKDMSLDAYLPSAGPIIVADANQIQQVLTNLVTNAWEAGGIGRSVRLTVKTVPAVDIATSYRPVDWSPSESAYACLEVADSGSGIAGKDIEELFDPFFTRKSAGAGLGLAVVLGIVRAHGGAVTVDSELGRGSTFRVFLPLSDEEDLRRPDQTVAVPDIEWSGTVLLVEDEEMVRKVGRATLKSLGFTVLLARDGVEALEVFHRNKDEIRCVLCDLTMPRMNGWETLAALRKLAPGLPVILASGYDKGQAMAGEHADLPQAFLTKPYGVHALRTAIAIALVHRKKPNASRDQEPPIF